MFQNLTGSNQAVTKQAIGVSEHRVPGSGVPFRVYYPCYEPHAAPPGAPTPWFNDTFATFIFGYLHCFTPLRKLPGWMQAIIANFLWLLTVLLPTAYFTVPQVLKDRQIGCSLTVLIPQPNSCSVARPRKKGGNTPSSFIRTASPGPGRSTTCSSRVGPRFATKRFLLRGQY